MLLGMKACRKTAPADFRVGKRCVDQWEDKNRRGPLQCDAHNRQFKKVAFCIQNSSQVFAQPTTISFLLHD